jgi:transposase-like protein
MRKRRTFTPEFKTEVVLEVLMGQRLPSELCREHQLSPQQVSEWKAEFLANAQLIFQRGTDDDTAQVRIAELERLVGRLSLELDAAKKLSRLLTASQPKNGKRS